MIKLLRESVENQNRNNELMIEATKELKKGMKEQYLRCLFNIFSNLHPARQDNHK